MSRGSGRVANEVGPLIIGPMRRRRDGNYDWRGQSNRSLEGSVASWVIDRLERVLRRYPGDL